MRPQILVVLAVILAGCNQSVAPMVSTTDEAKPCWNDPCLADPDSRNARYDREHYGLEQITSDALVPGFFDVDGRWVAWRVGGLKVNGSDVSRIYGYDIEERRLFRLSDERVDSIRPMVSGDVAVFVARPSGGGQHLVAWNFTSGARTAIETGLDGNPMTESFEGDWLLFSNYGSQDGAENGYWALNINTGEKQKFYSGARQIRFPDGSVQTLTAVAVDAGTVYYTITGAPASKQFNTTVFVQSLETGSVQSFRHSAWGATRMEAAGRYVAIEHSDAVAVLDTWTGNFSEVSFHDGKDCVLPQISGNILSYKCKVRETFPDGRKMGDRAMAINLLTGERVSIGGYAMHVFEVAVGGKTAVVNASHLDPSVYDISLDEELYYYRFPDEFVADSAP